MAKKRKYRTTGVSVKRRGRTTIITKIVRAKPRRRKKSAGLLGLGILGL